MPKFTPGPWFATGRYITDESQNKVVCAVPGSYQKVRKIDEANAQLIASAPMMLEALKQVRTALGDVKMPLMARAIVCIAIAKAEGRDE